MVSNLDSIGVYLLFFHKYLSPYLSPKKIMTCKSSRYTGHCGAKGSEIELFWGGFGTIKIKYRLDNSTGSVASAKIKHQVLN